MWSRLSHFPVTPRKCITTDHRGGDGSIASLWCMKTLLYLSVGTVGNGGSKRNRRMLNMVPSDKGPGQSRPRVIFTAVDFLG